MLECLKCSKTQRRAIFSYSCCKPRDKLYFWVMAFTIFITALFKTRTSLGLLNIATIASAILHQIGVV